MSYRLGSGSIPSPTSHGNAKENKPYYPTWPSTLSRVVDKCASCGPKKTVEHVSLEVGGILGASAPGQLPRNEKQVSNLRRRSKTYPVSLSCASDELFAVMQRAHTQDPEHKFVRDIKTAPEPAIVLADNQQLHDLVRFGTSAADFSIITIDPTFSLGEFDVTPLTYRHLLLETIRSQQLPIFLGPVLIHYRKTFASYLFFGSSLI